MSQTSSASSNQPKLTTVTFAYDELHRKWEVFVDGVADSVEARQAFNAVLLTAAQATPKLEANRAELLPTGLWKISVGQ